MCSTFFAVPAVSAVASLLFAIHVIGLFAPMDKSVAEPYTNALAQEHDIEGFRLEGKALVSFVDGAMRLGPVPGGSDMAQENNCVLWCPLDFGPNVSIEWRFRPLSEHGLAMVFFAARGKDGLDLFDPRLAPRDGHFDQYRRGDIDGLWFSYYRRSKPDERAFRVCNLRRLGNGDELCAQAADPIPPAVDASRDYAMRIQMSTCPTSNETTVLVTIDGLGVLRWTGSGPADGWGKVGFRQMAPLVASYSDLVVKPLA